VTLSRPRTVRRKQPSSSTNLRTLQSERALAARYRAREQSRHIPREFVLYLPPSLHPRAAATPAVSAGAIPQRILRTSSLPLILGQLDTALKRCTKARRPHHSRPMSPERLRPDSAPLHQDYMLPDPMLAPSHPASFTELGLLRTTRKGKAKEVPVRPQIPPPKRTLSEMGDVNRAPKAWWLDVSSPTWEDMRAIGKVNNLCYFYEFGQC
jgi:magnesium transporter